MRLLSATGLQLLQQEQLRKQKPQHFSSLATKVREERGRRACTRRGGGDYE